MKELSIEEKAKRYDRAIAHAKKLLKTIGNATLGNLVLKNEFERMFQELKESENWIPKEIIKYLKEKGDFRSCWIAWLEKQGQKPQGKSAFEAAKEEKVDNQNCVKLADKPEPKFKVGDDNWELVEQNPAWSKEDEDIINHLLALCSVLSNCAGAKRYRQLAGCSRDDVVEYQTWIKSLQDKVQPKQEWSEEDEKHRLNCLSYFNMIEKTSPYYEDYLWLKSLRNNNK